MFGKMESSWREVRSRQEVTPDLQMSPVVMFGAKKREKSSQEFVTGPKVRFSVRVSVRVRARARARQWGNAGVFC